MGLRTRPMLPQDVAECVEVIATHPVIGPRYGSAITDLGLAWLRVLECEAKSAVIIEEVTGSQTTICCPGVALFVGDAFVRELKTAPLSWFGPELAKRIAKGDSPWLSDKEFREANSCGGLNSVAWEGCIRPGFERHTEIHREIMSIFVESHRGYRWNEVLAAHMESVERLQWTLDTGGRLWDPVEGRWVQSPHQELQEIIREPHIVGVTRDMERGRPGTWVGALFDYRPPRIFFSRGEQRLLLSALLHKTDEELCEDLGASASTVKNTWRSIYNRATSQLPELFPDHTAANGHGSDRGKEKRRRLLAYIDEHPEELRPVSRKLVEEAAIESSRRVVRIA